MSWLWSQFVGQSGDAASGLKVFGGPHWKPATNIVSPDAPARPLPVLPPLLPVCAGPHADAPTPRTAPVTARPPNVRRLRRLASHVVPSSPGESAPEVSIR